MRNKPGSNVSPRLLLELLPFLHDGVSGSCQHKRTLPFPGCFCSWCYHSNRKQTQTRRNGPSLGLGTGPALPHFAFSPRNQSLSRNIKLLRVCCSSVVCVLMGPRPGAEAWHDPTMCILPLNPLQMRCWIKVQSCTVNVLGALGTLGSIYEHSSVLQLLSVVQSQ